VLPPIGVAVLRYDRPGDDVPFEDQVVDALAAVDELKTHRDVDPRRIGLWGFSQGAWIAPMVAARSRDIAFVVLVASVGVTPAVQMRYGTARHLREGGYDDAAVAKLLELRAVYEDYIRGRVDRGVAQRAVDAAAGEPWFARAYVRRTLPEEHDFWPDMDFDPVPHFAQVRVPTLLFYGEDDEWQPIDESIAAWRRAAKSAGNDDVTVVRLVGTRHTPTVADGGGVAPDYERRLIDWLRAHSLAMTETYTRAK
jgi:pimeloyl-ACP methyl ester carboxylesterase